MFWNGEAEGQLHGMTDANAHSDLHLGDDRIVIYNSQRRFFLRQVDSVVF